MHGVCTLSLVCACAVCDDRAAHTHSHRVRDGFAWLCLLLCLPAGSCFALIVGVSGNGKKDRESREIAKDLPVCFPLNFGSVSAAVMGGFNFEPSLGTCCRGHTVTLLGRPGKK